MKRFFAVLPLLLLVLLFPSVVGAAKPVPPITLYLNGQALNPDVPPRIINDSTVVPVRIIAENLGAEVLWDKTARKVTVSGNGLSMELWIDKPNAVVNGKKFALPAAPVIIDDVTMLPLRFIGEQLGLKVSWDQMSRSVLLYKAEKPAADKPDEDPGSLPADKPDEDRDSIPVDKPIESDEPALPAGDALQPPSDDRHEEEPADHSDPATEPENAPEEAGIPDDDMKIKAIDSVVMDGNLLIIHADGNIKPNSFSLDNPDRIVIDLPHAIIGPTLNGETPLQNGEIPVEHEIVQRIRYAVFSNEPSTVRIVVDLKKKAKYVVTRNEEAGQVILDLNPRRYTVVVDAGHGGTDPGAPTYSHRHEKEFTLAVALKVNRLLEKEPLIQPYLTRSDDTYITLQGRVEAANNMKADLFISIHGNRIDKPQVSGTETYYSRIESKAFAEVVHRHITEAAGFPDRKVKQADFYVIKHTTMPAVLAEIGFLSNKNDEAQMMTDSFQEKLAEAIVAAIKQYLQIN